MASIWGGQVLLTVEVPNSEHVEILKHFQQLHEHGLQHQLQNGPSLGSFSCFFQGVEGFDLKVKQAY